MGVRRLLQPIIAVLGVLAIVSAAGPAQAAPEQQLQTFRERMADTVVAMQDARLVLESKPQAQWSGPELEEYLVQAAWMAFYGNLIQLLETDSQPATGEDFVLQSAATVWPGNPLRNWEPMRVLLLDEPFSAGDLVFQACARGWESLSGYKLFPASFELSVYGADADYVASGESGGHPRNAEWARQPVGAVYTLGYWHEPATRSLEKAQQREAARRQAREAQPAAE